MNNLHTVFCRSSYGRRKSGIIAFSFFPTICGGAMPRRRKPAGLECLVDLARKAAILEQEMSVQREAIERLMENASRLRDKPDRKATARPTPSSPNWCP